MNDDPEKVHEENLSINVNIPKNEREAVQTGAEIGRSLFEVASTMRDSMIQGGATRGCSGNALLHAHIVALSLIIAVILYEMEDAPMPSSEELDERNKPIFKKLVEKVGDIITENAKRGHLIRIDKDGAQ